MDQTPLLDQARTLAAVLAEVMSRLAAPDDRLATSLPLAQLRLCRILYGGPRPMSALSREVGVSSSALTQIADRLEKARLVSRAPCGSDRRVRHLQLTERGRELVQRRESARVQRVLAVLEKLSPAQRHEVTAAIETLRKACDAMDEGDGARPALRARE